jgi:hypothetical protein
MHQVQRSFHGLASRIYLQRTTSYSQKGQPEDTRRQDVSNVRIAFFVRSFTALLLQTHHHRYSQLSHVVCLLATRSSVIVYALRSSSIEVMMGLGIFENRRLPPSSRLHESGMWQRLYRLEIEMVRVLRCQTGRLGSATGRNLGAVKGLQWCF